MSKIFYYPSSKQTETEWCKNLKANLGIEGPKINESAADIANVQTDCQSIIDINQQIADTRAALHKLVASRDDIDNTAGKRIRDYIKRLKTNPLYTVGLGKLLGILSSLVSDDLTNIKLVLKAAVTGRRIRINFGRKHKVDAINIYGRTGGTGDFAFMVTVARSPWYDERPSTTPGVPELREFYAMPVSDNKEVGQASDIVSVHFKG